MTDEDLCSLEVREPSSNLFIYFLTVETSRCFCDFYKTKLLGENLFSENEWSEGQIPVAQKTSRYFLPETQVNQLC